MGSELQLYTSAMMRPLLFYYTICFRTEKILNLYHIHSYKSPLNCILKAYSQMEAGFGVHLIVHLLFPVDFTSNTWFLKKLSNVELF